ncbi:hypothetical protein [Halorussus sp. MSC15.2]|uniref:hypothetical protein n=1 Tax=Halorussus sp. MSC15.2 TaxID=2283638 RepID=UPI0013D2DECC|nr:hypothetical protein [Halorussus sp. MSC15.2]NEU56592.1 hypothetical protein [Halorussus sp. MSC15.2]
MSETDLVTPFAEAEQNDYVRVTLSDGTTFEGPASPIDYVPEESLRVEVRPEGGTTERYEISGEYDDDWSELTVRGVSMEGEDSEWEDLGEVESVEFADENDN